MQSAKKDLLNLKAAKKMASHYQVINPHNAEIIEEYAFISDNCIEDHLNKTHLAFLKFKSISLKTRSDLLLDLASELLEQKEGLAKKASLCMGKPIKQAIAEIEKCAWVCRYYAENGPQWLYSDPVDLSETTEGQVIWQPLGVILAIMPWNFPFWQVFRHLAPAIMLGNAVFLKHAPNVWPIAKAIDELLLLVGLPNDFFKTLPCDTQTTQKLIEHPLIKAVTFTGSTPVGAQIASKAAKNLKKTVLELGGNDPALIFGDCDLAQVIPQIYQARMQNNGQSCIATKRVLIQKEIFNPFCNQLIDFIKKNTKIGDPFDSKNNLGPLARKDLKQNLKKQVVSAQKKGFSLVFEMEGKASDINRGFYLKPLVLQALNRASFEFDEELFGPVFSLISFESEDEALKAANQTQYGLSASLFTQNQARISYFCQNLNVGTVAVNQPVHSDPRLPFGGTKHSGYGRELGLFGLSEFANIQTQIIKK